MLPSVLSLEIKHFSDFKSHLFLFLSAVTMESVKTPNRRLFGENEKILRGNLVYELFYIRDSDRPTQGLANQVHLLLTSTRRKN